MSVVATAAFAGLAVTAIMVKMATKAAAAAAVATMVHLALKRSGPLLAAKETKSTLAEIKHPWVD